MRLDLGISNLENNLKSLLCSLCRRMLLLAFSFDYLCFVEASDSCVRNARAIEGFQLVFFFCTGWDIIYILLRKNLNINLPQLHNISTKIKFEKLQ